MINIKQQIKTKAPVLDLTGHFFPEVQVRANPEVTQETLDSGDAYDIDFVTNVRLSQSDERPDNYLIEFNLCTDKKQADKAWEISVTVVGSFVLPECEEQKRIGIVMVNGQSMLYGIVREFLYSLTSKGPFDPVYLPTITFYPDPENEIKEPD